MLGLIYIPFLITLDEGFAPVLSNPVKCLRLKTVTSLLSDRLLFLFTEVGHGGLVRKSMCLEDMGLLFYIQLITEICDI